MDTCKKIIISGNYKDMEEKINFLISDGGSWCIDYEDKDLMDIATLEFYKNNVDNKEGYFSFECEDKYIFFIFLSIIQKLGLV